LTFPQGLALTDDGAERAGFGGRFGLVTIGLTAFMTICAEIFRRAPGYPER
jgi:hypothetical protein